MASKRKEINLLPASDFEKSLAGRIFSWSLTAGRYIIITTELIVIIAFISRFKLDKDLAVLNESIKEKQAAIASFGELESKVRSLQTRIKTIKELQLTQMETAKILESLSQVIPSDIYLTKLSLDKDSLTADGVALSDASLNIFLSGLQKSEDFSKINLNSLTTQGPENPKIEFTIEVNMQNEASPSTKASDIRRGENQIENGL